MHVELLAFPCVPCQDRPARPDPPHGPYLVPLPFSTRPDLTHPCRPPRISPTPFPACSCCTPAPHLDSSCVPALSRHARRMPNPCNEHLMIYALLHGALVSADADDARYVRASGVTGDSSAAAGGGSILQQGPVVAHQVHQVGGTRVRLLRPSAVTRGTPLLYLATRHDCDHVPCTMRNACAVRNACTRCHAPACARCHAPCEVHKCADMTMFHA